MKIINQTDYPTPALRSIMVAVHNAEPRGRLKTWARLTVTIRYARKGDRPYTGNARYNGLRCTLSVPRPATTYAPGVDVTTLGDASLCRVVRFAALWRHEMWHLYGIRHAAYTDAIMWCQPECVDHVHLGPFADVHAVPPASAKTKPTKTELQAQKVAGLQARRLTWRRKKSRAENAIAKIDRSLRYYDRAGVDGATTERAATPRRRVRK